MSTSLGSEGAFISAHSNMVELVSLGPGWRASRGQGPRRSHVRSGVASSLGARPLGLAPRCYCGWKSCGVAVGPRDRPAISGFATDPEPCKPSQGSWPGSALRVRSARAATAGHSSRTPSRCSRPDRCGPAGRLSCPRRARSRPGRPSRGRARPCSWRSGRWRGVRPGARPRVSPYRWVVPIPLRVAGLARASAASARVKRGLLMLAARLRGQALESPGPDDRQALGRADHTPFLGHLPRVRQEESRRILD